LAPKLSQAEFEPRDGLLFDDTTGQEPKHHTPHETLDQKEQEPGEADGL
jgi:hypothetical protein